MIRALVTAAVLASPLLASSAQACSLEHCPWSKPVCDLGVVDCSDSVKERVCRVVDFEPYC